MRCPQCGGEIPDGSRFCGICGRNITAPVEALARPARGQGRGDGDGGGDGSMSLFELPVSRRARAF